MINPNKYLTEFLGTVLLLTCILASGGNAAVVGAGLATAVYFAGSISGGHINPAVSIAMFVNNKIKFEDLFGYIFAQVSGGVAAVYLYNAVMKK
jgi:aquaporin Z